MTGCTQAAAPTCPARESAIENDRGLMTDFAAEDNSMNMLSAAGLAGCLAPVLALLPARARGQLPPLPPGVVQQLNRAIGQRVEATAVLATQNTVSRIGLGWTLNDADGAIYRIPWQFELHDPRPVGDCRVTSTFVYFDTRPITATTDALNFTSPSDLKDRSNSQSAISPGSTVLAK